MSVSEYPKLLWSPEGVEICVGDATVEAEKLALGYRRTVEVLSPSVVDDPDGTPPDVDVYEDEPTFGPPGDQTHTKRSSKKK